MALSGIFGDSFDPACCILVQGVTRTSEVLLGDEAWPHSSVKTVDTKILPVHGEDFSDALTFGNPYECRISEVHRTVGVLAHQFAHSRNIRVIERQELQQPSREHFPKSFLGFGQIA